MPPIIFLPKSSLMVSTSTVHTLFSSTPFLCNKDALIKEGRDVDVSPVF